MRGTISILFQEAYMDDFRTRLIHLHHCRGIGWKTIYQILKNDPLLTSLFNGRNLSFLPTSTQEKLLSDVHSPIIQEQIKHYYPNNIHAITYFDDEYPSLLKETYEPPWVLYGKGDMNLLKSDQKLAVVGSRQPTDYGKMAIEAIFPQLIEKGYMIVSGLAAGIDTISHETAIKYGGRTIAVIAGGLFHIYPKQNSRLALEMMRNHLVLSEYPPYTKPLRWHFPMRNRIISGMSRGTFIVEARRNSGSLITANYAVQEGREVFALPGSVLCSNSIGTNELIQQGAKLVNTAEDILNEFMY